MAEKPRGRKVVTTLRCSCCGKDLELNEFYTFSNNRFYKQGLPICRNCIKLIYYDYYNKYKIQEHANPERDAIRRICMALNIYYNENIVNKAIKQSISESDSTNDLPVIYAYLRIVRLIQFSKKSFDTTIEEENSLDIPKVEFIKESDKISEETIKFWGSGFADEDYMFMQEQYDDWCARHECNTKAQEEIFKQICITQLELQKATKHKQDTKDLTATFQKLLDSANLQPKQNKNNALVETETFGTLIDKWENTRPIPEIDEDLRDVDKIGLYIDTFFRGHLAKMMGLKNGLSHLYDKFMKKYTVEKPEYDSDEDGEALFDAIFGNSIDDE